MLSNTFLGLPKFRQSCLKLCLNFLESLSSLLKLSLTLACSLKLGSSFFGRLKLGFGFLKLLLGSLDLLLEILKFGLVVGLGAIRLIIWETGIVFSWNGIRLDTIPVSQMISLMAPRPTTRP